MWKRITVGVVLVFGALLLTVLGEELWVSVQLLARGESLGATVRSCDCEGPRVGRTLHCQLDLMDAVEWKKGTFKWSAHRHCHDEDCDQWSACVPPPRRGCPAAGDRVQAYWVAGDSTTVRLTRVPIGTWLLCMAALLLGITVLRSWLIQRRQGR